MQNYVLTRKFVQDSAVGNVLAPYLITTMKQVHPVSVRVQHRPQSCRYSCCFVALLVQCRVAVLQHLIRHSYLAAHWLVFILLLHQILHFMLLLLLVSLHVNTTCMVMLDASLFLIGV